MSIIRLIFSLSLFLNITLLMLPVTAYASACVNEKDNIPWSAPTKEFTLHANGTVTQNTTGLMWMRCSKGQSWDGDSCTGSANAYNWQNALALKNSTFAGFNDWRLPNKNELVTIVEQRCTLPAINAVVFPNTPNNWYWSSSSYARDSNYGWIIGFGTGRIYDEHKNNLYRVRLVRAEQ